MRLLQTLLSLVLLLVLSFEATARENNTTLAIVEFKLQAINDTAFTLHATTESGNLVTYSV